MKVLVTGANGFVGRAVCRRLLKQGCQVVGAVRRLDADVESGVEARLVAPLSPETPWADALAGVDAVVHLAARVHVMNDRSADPLAEFRRVNSLATLHLAEQAAQQGVHRFVYMSSIKVNGESAEPDQPFTADDEPAPVDPYGVSKAEAEAGLAYLAAQNSGLHVSILRPPLVYGPGVRGNFLSLLTVVARGIPLPFGAVDNRRSLIGVENLADAVACLLTEPAGRCETFLVSDGDDVSTPELIRQIAASMQRPARLFAVPPQWLRLAGALTGQAAAIDRLCGSLVVDCSAIQARLGWRPPHSLDQGLADTVAWFKQR